MAQRVILLGESMRLAKLLLLFLSLLLVSLVLIDLSDVSRDSLFAASCSSADCSSPQECEEKIKECQEIIGAYSPAQSKNKEQLQALERQLNNTESLLKQAEIQADKLAQEIEDREADLADQREVFSIRVRDFYKRSRGMSLFLILLSSQNATELTRELSYRNVAANEDRKVILDISQKLIDLTQDKQKLSENRTFLEKTKQSLGSQTAFLKKEVGKVEDYLGVLSNRVAGLSAKQKALLEAKVGTFQTSVGEVPLADDPASRPDYNPGFSPAFAGFSFGAPHRKGMSQYGALGRAQGGQSYEQILKAYYGDVRVEKRDFPATIATTVGGLDFEGNYLKGIAEMPSSWAGKGGFEALKAQAIAARSYAIRAGKPICVTEACQVYSSSKAGNPAAADWHRAVEETRGIVVVSNQSNEVVSTWYASTAGGALYSYTSSGHSTPMVWDTACGSKDCWTSEAWEKKAGSPWFYKGWYKSRGGTTCGRSHPWLNESEMADILNAVIVYRNGGDDAASHILPEDYVSCFGSSGDPWNKDRMKQAANGLGGAIISVGGVSVTYATNGQTNKVSFSTNKGNFEVNGDEFKTVFNLRAPGRIALKSMLFNLEKK